tara:strand:+ start:754 stop:981 length:228 start_codon:yes stop_codon:yes gene_type:complete
MDSGPLLTGGKDIDVGIPKLTSLLMSVGGSMGLALGIARQYVKSGIHPAVLLFNAVINSYLPMSAELVFNLTPNP